MVLSSTSPNGQHKAEVLERMSELGSRIEVCYVRINGKERDIVGRTQSHTHVRSIHWSPDSAIVVFEQDYHLDAFRLRDRKKTIAMRPSCSKAGSSQYCPLQRIDFRNSRNLVISYRDFPTSQTIDFTERYVLTP